MAQRDLFKRYLDAGMEFSALTQARAEAIVGDLVKAGEVQANQAQQAVQDLVDRSRKNSERLVEQIRKEVQSTVSSLGLATKDDVGRLEQRLNDLDKKVGAQPAPTPQPPSAAKRTTKTASSTSASATPPKPAPRKRP